MNIEMPNDIHAEQIVIGACLSEAEAVDLVQLELKPEYFFEARHKEIFIAISELWSAEEAINPLSIAQRLKHRGILEGVGGYDYIKSLELGARYVDCEHYANAIVEAHKKRQLKKLCLELLSEEDCSAEELLEKASSKVMNIATQKQGDIRNIGQIIRKFKDDKSLDEIVKEKIEQRRSGVIPLEGVPIGYNKLDGFLGGLAPSRLVLLGARPGQGKSEFICQFACKMAANRIPILIFSMEMGEVEWGNRCVGIKSSVMHSRIPTGDLSDEEYLRVTEVCLNQTNQLSHIYVDDKSNRSISQIRAISRAMQQKHGIKAIFIDHLGLISQKGNNRYEIITEISRQLKMIAKELDICVFSACQFNRNPTRKEDGRATIADLRDSGALEQDADQILLMHRPDLVDPHNKPGIVQLMLEKNRHGERTRIDFAFNSLTQELYELDMSIEELMNEQE